MQSILLFIEELEQQNTHQIKHYYALISATIWTFSLKIAEKFFLYNEDAQKYASEILFLQLNAPFQEVHEKILQDFELYQVQYNENEVYDLFLQAHTIALEKVNENKKNDYYI